MTHIEIEGVLNARVFGDETPWLLRTAALDAITPAGIATLRGLGVTSVVDLREDVERPDGLGPIAVRSIPLYGTPEGPPRHGSLDEVYARLLRERGASVAEAVAAIADADGAVLVHCSAGKDRTGIVVALALLAAGATVDDVIADYALSGALIEHARRPLVEALLAELALDADAAAATRSLHLESPASALRSALAILDEWGGPHAYLLRHGVTVEQLTALAERGAAW
ncbi:Protein tyrosine/serine phosphatase [Rathayibacter oskolensis]|uniref:Protein tyrosine/serine phosphatase n=1 Tax=Rathayibacter oskolensis TaxID=1891671 RepID=A0A1X7PBR2_9MICO|nr:tyrosine-protein phosphatase [Rathayibacter oskolensis]SMH48646.1 Protein tyrosine/serine phosphatase [Rathayibacter oskolensis]